MSKKVYSTGDQYAPAGSVPWANWQRSAMHNRLKGTTWEAKHLVSQIRAMCEGDEPAWHLMETEAGRGFRTFEEFVTTSYPWGLGFADYAKFKAIILSDLKNEREYELMVAGRPLEKGQRTDLQPVAESATGSPGQRARESRLRAIRRAGPLAMQLYRDGLIDPALAAMLGPESEEKKAKASVALRAVKAVPRNGDDASYRRAVNDAVRGAFGKRLPTPLDLAKKAAAKLTAADRSRLIEWLTEEED